MGLLQARYNLFKKMDELENKPLLQKDKGCEIKLPDFNDGAGLIKLTPKQLEAMKKVIIGKTFCIIEN